MKKSKATAIIVRRGVGATPRLNRVVNAQFAWRLPAQCRETAVGVWPRRCWARLSSDDTAETIVVPGKKMPVRVTDWHWSSFFQRCGLVAVHRELGADRFNLLADACFNRFVAQVGEDLADPARQCAALVFLEAASGHGWGADAQA